MTLAVRCTQYTALTCGIETERTSWECEQGSTKGVSFKVGHSQWIDIPWTLLNAFAILPLPWTHHVKAETTVHAGTARNPAFFLLQLNSISRAAAQRWSTSLSASTARCCDSNLSGITQMALLSPRTQNSCWRTQVPGILLFNLPYHISEPCPRHPDSLSIQPRIATVVMRRSGVLDASHPLLSSRLSMQRRCASAVDVQSGAYLREGSSL